MDFSSTEGVSEMPTPDLREMPKPLESQQYERLVQSVVDYAIYMLLPDGSVASWNAGAQRIKGYDAGEIIGRNFSQFYAPEDRKAGLPQRGLEQARETGRYEAEGWRVRKDGTSFWASVVIDAIRDDDQTLIGFAKVTRDVTERREAQARMDELREHLFQSQKMEALGQLTGGLAHDFNNLLTAIISGAELALRNKNDPERLERLLQGVLSAGRRGGGLTRQLLAFARRQPLETRAVDLKDQLPETVALLRHSVGAGIELVTEISDRLWTIETDPSQFELAVLNLGLNGRDAMAGGGILKLTAVNVHLTGDPDGLEGEFVAISVADGGTGMPPEIRARVFEPFFTTKSFGQGTGLGLSQVYGFVRQSRGAVTIDSTVGEGTTVTLYLPAAKGGVSEANVARAGGAARVLVIEDDPVVAELAVAMLSELGYAAAVTHSAGDALAMLARDPGFDAVFTDIIMPGGMSGLELARKIRQRQPELPILLTTGFSERVGQDLSEFPLLAKPYDFASLETALAELLPSKSRA